MKVLILTVHLFPNVGGVETHLSDLFAALTKRGFEIFCLAYQPLSTKTKWKILEKSKNLTILRIPWIRGFFEKLVSSPVLEFIYLIPGIFLITPIFVLIFRPNVIHAQGLSAGVSAVFWGKVFNVRTVISLHSIYTFPKSGLYHDFVKTLFKNTDAILSLSKKSNEEVRALGIDSKKSKVFTYWIDLNKFKIKNQKSKIKNKGKLGWKNEFIVLFVGRLIKEKGIDILLKASKMWDRNIKLAIVGSGPLEENINKEAKGLKQIQFLGKIDQENLPLYYFGADCLIVPSISEEGFGRVIIESLACGTPVLASKNGAIGEAMDETVGKFFETSPESIKNTVEYFYYNKSKLKALANKTRQFAERRYSESNAQTIIKSYTG